MKDPTLERRQPKPFTGAEREASSTRLEALTLSTPLQSLYPGRLIIAPDNTVSGTKYIFDRAGDIVNVLNVDAPLLLALRRGPTGCCGSAGEGERRYVIQA